MLTTTTPALFAAAQDFMANFRAQCATKTVADCQRVSAEARDINVRLFAAYIAAGGSEIDYPAYTETLCVAA